MFSCCVRKIHSSAMTLMVLASAVFAHAAQQTGSVRSGPTPIEFSSVTLYSAGMFQNASPTILGRAQTGADGSFTVTFTPPSDTSTVLYLIADGGSPASDPKGGNPVQSAIRFATVLGTSSIPAGVVINERTTVASAYAMAQFISGAQIAGKSPGLQNAGATIQNLVDLTTGEVGSVLGSPPNGLETSAMREFNSLANMLASCVNASTSGSCASLFDFAKPPGGGPPRDTLQAVVDIAHYPGHNAHQLFQQSQILTLYGPALASAPDAWTLAIRYDGNGVEFDGPGNMAVDKDGNVWSTNNFEFSSNPFQSVCGGRQILKLTPTGLDAPGAPYSGGGLYGAGFGITLDPNGNLWVGNFGFQGTSCPLVEPDNSVSEFSSSGDALSPDITGFTQGNISRPQGTVSDQQGNIWIANCGSNSVTQFAGGNPGDARNFSNLGLAKPFGMAIDAEGNAWITSNGNDSVVGLAPDGTPLPGSPFSGGGIKAPLGIAVDSLGNVWVANSGIVPLPCGINAVPNVAGNASVTQLRRDGQRARLSAFTGGGLTIPWGIAVDGNDNIWVANFGQQRLSEFCGARPSNCPPGHTTGDPISPPTGYTSDALTRNTGLVIDPSGNIWVANNLLNVLVAANPGGHELVVFIGLAAPVKTPSIGPPQQP